MLLVSKDAVKPARDGHHGRAARAAARLPSLSARIRSRRAELGLTGATLAERAGISASYVSLIETGVKVPDDGVAAAIARGLGDDEALYRAWARGARLGLDDLDLLNRLERISRTPAYVKLVESGGELPQLEGPATRPPASSDSVDLASRLRAVAAQLTSPVGAEGRPEGFADRARRPAKSDTSGVLGIPVLAPGADPDPSRSPTRLPLAAHDQLLLDARLFSPDATSGLFAYEVTPSALKHLRGLAAPGDHIVFQRGHASGPERISAVRTKAGVVLARVLYKHGALLLLPGDGESSFETMPVESARALDDSIAGTHVLLVRRAPAMPTPAESPRTTAPSRTREPVG
jgi:transcriptional regulator with XRE-family HTH domain